MSGSGQATQAEREAARWIARLEAANVSLDDHRKFRRWLNAAPGNRAAYEAVARTWDKLDTLQFLDPTAVEPSLQPSRRWLLAGGAGGAIAAVAAGVLIIPMIGDANATPYATRVGERKSFRLADGSSAELNADSAIRVALTSKARRVRLVQGEALFDVRPDAGRPFVVETAFGELRVHGTIFLVKLGIASTRATVLQGEVEGVGEASLFSRPASTLAAANQEITLDGAQVTQAPLAPQALAHRLAWRDGMLAFDGDTLADAALEIERQTGVHFQFADPAVAHMRVGGYISATDVDAFVELVQADLRLHAARPSANVVILSR
ncbi:MAG: FecR domain-containing protein [Proteobacteria bacterium]|nr:FecR domain-containing protein [Pseudomonadota bacterium]